MTLHISWMCILTRLFAGLHVKDTFSNVMAQFIFSMMSMIHISRSNMQVITLVNLKPFMPSVT